MKRPTLYYFRNLLCVVAEEKKKNVYQWPTEHYLVLCFFFSVFIFFYFLFFDALFGANLTFYA